YYGIQRRVNFVREIVIVADGEQADRKALPGKIVDSLIVVPGGANQSQAGFFARAKFQKLIGGIDLVPKTIDGPPRQSDCRDQSENHSSDHGGGLSDLEQ